MKNIFKDLIIALLVISVSLMLQWSTDKITFWGNVCMVAVVVISGIATIVVAITKKYSNKRKKD